LLSFAYVVFVKIPLRETFSLSLWSSTTSDQLCMWILSHFVPISSQGSIFSFSFLYISSQFLSFYLFILLFFSVVFLFLIAISFSASEIGTNQRLVPLKSLNSPSFSSNLRFLRKSAQNSSGVSSDDGVIIVDHGSRRKESNLMLSKKSFMKSVMHLGMF
jgi:hypothetical protein